MSTALLDLQALTFNGQSAAVGHADVVQAILGDGELTIRETITGASTIEMTLSDPDWSLTTSGLLAARTATVLDGAAFELTAVRRESSSGAGHVAVTFEDLAVAQLRRKTGYRASSVGTTTRTGFCRTLIREVPGITVAGPNSAKALEQLARGTDPATASTTGTATSEKPEDTWTAVGRIMGEIGWRAFCRRGTVTIAPDSWLVAQAGKYVLTPASDGVESIDFDFDAAAVSSTATLTVRAGKQDLIPGTPVTLAKTGVADGAWIVETVERRISTTKATVSLIRPTKELPEPTGSNTGNLGDLVYPDGSNLDFTLPSLAGSPSGVDPVVTKFVNAALSKSGHSYLYGGNGPAAYDCSHLVAYAAGVAGLKGVSAPVSALLATCTSRGQLLSVEQAIGAYGALLIRGPNEHVAISLGNGKTIEARGKAYGIGQFPATGRSWTVGGILPGLAVKAASVRDLRG